MDAANRDEEAGLPQNAGTEPQARQRPSVPSFLFISFILFMLTSHNGDEFLARHQHQDALQTLALQLSNYTAWMNGTSSNFSMPEHDPHILPMLETFKVNGEDLDPFQSSYFSNVTGFIHGTTQYYNISPPALATNDSISWRPLAEKLTEGANMTELTERLGEWNWTSPSKVAFSLVEKKPASANQSDTALVHGRVEFTDTIAEKDLRLEFEGIHFLSNGSIYGFAEPSSQAIDIRRLPSLVPQSGWNATINMIGPELETRITKLRNLIDAGIVDDNDSDDGPKTNCTFAFYGQIHPLPVPQFLMQEYEEEIQTPTGISTVTLPPLSMSAVLISKDCGILYEILETEGLRSRTFFRKMTTYAGLSALAYLAILVLFSRQVEKSRTPSGISRVSKWMFLSQASMDSVSFAGHITFAILAEGRPSVSLIAPAFLACMLFVQQAQFFALINQVQGPESYTPPTSTATNANARSTNTGPATPAPGSPPTATSNPPAQTPPTNTPTPAATPTPQPQSMSFFQFMIHHIRTDPQARLWFSLFIFLTLIVRVILSPTLSMIFVASSYSLIWLPQIVRSARRGRESGLSVEYVVGVTVCRLYSAMYFLMCPKNVLEVEPRAWAPFLAAFVVLQAALLLLQDAIGPSFFLPERFKVPKTYDYHPVLPLPDTESPDQSLGDCAICMEPIYVDPALRAAHDHNGPKSKKSSEYPDEKHSMRASASAHAHASALDGGLRSGGLLNAMNVGGIVGRKSYSLAPCHHLFHTECLEKWLAIKNICPHCRRPLPPL